MDQVMIPAFIIFGVILVVGLTVYTVRQKGLKSQRTTDMATFAASHGWQMLGSAPDGLCDSLRTMHPFSLVQGYSTRGLTQYYDLTFNCIYKKGANGADFFAFDYYASQSTATPFPDDSSIGVLVARVPYRFPLNNQERTAKAFVSEGTRNQIGSWEFFGHYIVIPSLNFYPGPTLERLVAEIGEVLESLTPEFKSAGAITPTWSGPNDGLDPNQLQI